MSSVSASVPSSLACPVPSELLSVCVTELQKHKADEDLRAHVLQPHNCKEKNEAGGGSGEGLNGS